MNPHQTKYLTADEKQCASHCQEIWETACVKYELPPEVVFVLQFQSKLQVYRTAKKKNGRHAVGKANYDVQLGLVTVTLNRDAITQNLADMLNDTIPHEVAHAVCMIRPELGDGHNEGWQKICKELGGTGFHNYAYNDYDMRQRKHPRYIYNVPDRGQVVIGKIRHKQLQDGSAGFTIQGVSIGREHWTGQVV